MKESHLKNGSTQGRQVPRWLAQVELRVRDFSGMENLRKSPWRLRSKVLQRMDLLDLEEPNRYLRLLKNPTQGPQELRALMEMLVVGETSWFRHEKQIRDLKRHILPELETFAGASPIRIWSAGCSEGQEVYSLAISLLHRIPRPEFFILGTDLSRVAVEKASKGVYDYRAKGSLSERDKKTFFSQDPLNRLQANTLLKRHCRFQVHNLMDEKYPGRFHIIFCRNVLIYMTPKARGSVLQKLSDALLPGGVLVLGYSETSKVSGSFVLPIRVGDSLFWRKEHPDTLCKHEHPRPKEAAFKTVRRSTPHQTVPKAPRKRQNLFVGSNPSEPSGGLESKVLTLQGPFPKEKMSALASQLRELLAQCPTRAVVEVDGVDFFCQEAAQQLRRAAAQQLADGGEFILVASKPGVRHWVQRSKLEHWMKIVEDHGRG